MLDKQKSALRSQYLAVVRQQLRGTYDLPKAVLNDLCAASYD